MGQCWMRSALCAGLLAGGWATGAQAQLIPPLPEIPRNNVSDQTVTQNSLTTTIQVVTTTISTRVSDAIRPSRPRIGGQAPTQTAMIPIQLASLEVTPDMLFAEATGSAGGTVGTAGAAQWTGWANASLSWLKDDFAASRYDGRVYAPLLGVDRVQNGVVVGVSFGYERIDLDTDFNNGSLIGDGLSITPYVGVLLNDDVTLDAGLGYTRLNYDRAERVRVGAAAIRRDFDADRFTAFTNLTGYAPASWTGDSVSVAAVGGLSWTVEKQKASVDSAGQRIDSGTNKVGRVTAGLRVNGNPTLAADGTAGFEPIASLTYQYDFHLSDDTQTGERIRPRERSDLLASAGFGFGLTPGARMTVEYSRLFARSEFDSQTVLVSARMEF